jgi:hypothetical protein
LWNVTSLRQLSVLGMVEHQQKAASRYELRYFIPHGMVSRIRDFVGEYMELDEHGIGKPNCSYPVHTLYLDSDDWKIYWKTVRGDQTRLKLRVRYYSDSPEAPVFLEIKRQMTDQISKQRGAVRRDAVSTVLAGFLPDPAQMCSREPKEWMAVEHFVDLLAEWGAKPKLHVACLREAYVSPEQSARVTIDWHIQVGPVSDELLTTRMEDLVATLDDVLILELRFTECYPDWYKELVRTFNLSRPFSVRFRQKTTRLPGLDIAPEDVIHNIVL